MSLSQGELTCSHPLLSDASIHSLAWTVQVEEETTLTPANVIRLSPGPPASESTFPHFMVTCISEPFDSLHKSRGILDVMAMYQHNYFILSNNNGSKGFRNGVCKYVLRMPRTNPDELYPE